MSTKEESKGRRRKATENSSPGPARKLRSRQKPETGDKKLKPLENKPVKSTEISNTEEVSSKYFKKTEEVPSQETSQIVPSTSSNETPEKDDLFSQILKSKRTIEFKNVSRAVFPFSERSCNITHCLNQVAISSRFKSCQKQSLHTPVSEMISNMVLCKKERPFDRRVTAIEWHPTNPNVAAIGSKGGDIILLNLATEKSCDKFIQGKGPGGSIQAVKFMPREPSKLLTASIDGTVCLHNVEPVKTYTITDTGNCYEGPGGNISGIKFNPHNPTQIYTSALDGKLALQDLTTGQHSQIFLDTLTWDFWYCSVDINPKSNVIATGDNTGKVILLTSDGHQTYSQKLHKNKVTHVEFSPREEWILCTASTDQTVKIWDTRMMKDKKSYLSVLNHDKPVNSAYFNPRDGTRLLTTDQHHELRIYQSGSWTLEKTIEHPHRFFQHITPIKAAWHPLEDLIVAGRYPDPDTSVKCSGPDDIRSIDIYGADSGSRHCHLLDPGAKGIVTLNKFNNQGDILASAMGFEILIWQRQEEAEKIQEKFMDQVKASRVGTVQGRGPSASGQSSRGRGGQNKQRKPAAREKQPNTKVTLKTKVKTKQDKK